MTLVERTKVKIDHLTPNEWIALDEIVTRLCARYGEDLLRVVLLGSIARGDFHEESDSNP